MTIPLQQLRSALNSRTSGYDKVGGVTEPEFLRHIREGYDRTAGPYAARFHDHLDGKPVDRAMLLAFAGLVTMGDNTRVADVGCGTGATTRILRDLSVQPLGVDLSPEMIREARQRSSGLDFIVGSMTDLNLDDNSVGGVCAWYSIIHTPDDHLASVFAEFYRVLTPGGVVLLAFQIGDEPRLLAKAFGHDVDLTFYRRTTEFVESLLAQSGLRMYARLVREAEDDGLESTPHAYLIARKA